MEEGSYLMDRPAGGWSDLVTNHTLDLKFREFEARLDGRFAVVDERLVSLEHRMIAVMERRFRVQTWSLVTAMFAGLGMLAALLRV